MHPDRQAICEETLQAPSQRHRILAFAVALAFFLQSLVVQTHLHFPPGPVGTTAAAISKTVGLSLGTMSPDLPLKGDPADCPLCQAGILSGAFIAPAAAIFLPVISFILFKLGMPSDGALSLRPSHNWQGRAPPRI